SLWNSSESTSRRHQDRVAHAVHKFFVGLNDGGQSAAQFHSIVLHKIIRTETDTPFHGFQFAGIRVPVAMFEQAALVKALHDRWRRVESGQRIVDSLFPFGVGEIGPERDAPTAPPKRRESADF